MTSESEITFEELVSQHQEDEAFMGPHRLVRAGENVADSHCALHTQNGKKVYFVPVKLYGQGGDDNEK